MSSALFARSEDLGRLRNEGYDVEERSGYLLLRDVPYVHASRQVQRGTLVTALSLAGDQTTKPGTHVVYFNGDHPCNADGSPIAHLVIGSEQQQLAEGLTVRHTFSSKPGPQGYSDYYEQMTTYASILSHPAAVLDPAATPRTYPAIAASEEESVFCYLDTASSRAGIGVVTAKLEGLKIGIIGLGGTGSYVLDLVAKTPVAEIHLFDGDRFSQHNAFRSPGAPSLEELQERPTKVAFFHRMYSRMRRGIVRHDRFLDASNVAELEGLDFAFLCLDAGEPKRLAVERLEASGIPFVDVGMGIELVDESLLGLLRVTTSTPEKRDHFRERVSLVGGGEDDDYDRNIQIADLNALNAALAVIKWKKLVGFYMDQENEHQCTYALGGNVLINDERT